MPKCQSCEKRCDTCPKRNCPTCPMGPITLSPATITTGATATTVIATGINLNAVTSVTLQVGAGVIQNVPFVPSFNPLFPFFNNFNNGCCKKFPVNNIPSQLTLTIPAQATAGTGILTFNSLFCPPIIAILPITA